MTPQSALTTLSSSGLQEEGWSFRDEALRNFLAEHHDGNSNVRELLLDTDLKKVGKAHLPEDLAKIENRIVAGPYVLQIESVEDVSSPSYGGVQTSKQRVLLLMLTDGRVTCKAVELKPCMALDQKKVSPGTKLQIAGATVRSGILVLEDKSVKVLGGSVEAMIEAWEFQKRFGGDRQGEAAAASSLHAPKFTPFQPGKTRPPALYMPSNQGQQMAGGGKGTAALPTATQARQEPDRIRDAGMPDFRSFQNQGDTSVAQLAAAREQGAAKQKLLDKLTDAEPGRGRGRGRARGRGRRRGFDAEADSSMTLAEWEAKQKGGGRAAGEPRATDMRLQSDEELARRMQEELDLEDAGRAPQQQEGSKGAAEDLKRSLFSFTPPAEEGFGRRGGSHRGRSSGRGRSRGRPGRAY